MRPPPAQRVSSRLGPVLGLLLLCLALGACAGGDPNAPVKVIEAIAGAAAFAERKSKAGQAFKHYIERRVAYLTDATRNPSWLTESGHTSLMTRIGVEMDALSHFLDTTLAALAADGKTPAYRDLADAAKRLVTDGPTRISSRTARFQRQRKERAAQIVWRAGASQPGVWAGGDSSLSPTLQQEALTELVDRRLRPVEIMMLHDGGNIGTWSVTAADSGWKDQQRSSMWEYPWVDEFDSDGTPVFANALGAVGLTPADLAPTWVERPSEERLYFQPALNRLRAPAAADWTVSDQNPYAITYSGAGPVSEALERVMPSAPTLDAVFEDFWQRNWFYCDMMIALLHVEGLRFARRRRKGSDADFDGAAAAGVRLLPLIPRTGVPDPRALMDNGLDWFEGVSIPHDDIQVGDHLVLWNSLFVRKVLFSAFGLENSLVTRIDDDGHTLMMAGHGEPEFTEGHFLEELAGEIKDQFRLLRRDIDDRIAADPGATLLEVKRTGLTFHMVNWAPFGETFVPSSRARLRSPGAWWVRMKLEELREDDKTPPPTLQQALDQIPKSVSVDTSRMTPPPLPAGDPDTTYQGSVYLPLSVPKGVSKGWTAYLANPRPGATVELSDLIPDGDMVPGLHGNGPAATIPILRPILKP